MWFDDYPMTSGFEISMQGASHLSNADYSVDSKSFDIEFLDADNVEENTGEDLLVVVASMVNDTVDYKVHQGSVGTTGGIFEMVNGAMRMKLTSAYNSVIVVSTYGRLICRLFASDDENFASFASQSVCVPVSNVFFVDDEIGFSAFRVDGNTLIASASAPNVEGFVSCFNYVASLSSVSGNFEIGDYGFYFSYGAGLAQDPQLIRGLLTAETSV